MINAQIITLLFLLVIKSIFCQANYNKMRQLSSHAITSLIYGNVEKINYYYTTLYMSKDKIYQTFIIDTTTDITSSPCSLCRECGEHTSIPYNVSKNNKINFDFDECSQLNAMKNNLNECSFNTDFIEGSTISGVYINTEVSFPLIEKERNMTDSHNILIGCTTKETHYFKVQHADGILGLGNTKKSIVEYLYKEKVIKNNLFTLCFAYEGGYFSLGEINSDFHSSSHEITYFPISSSAQNPSQYVLKASFISVNSIEIPLQTREVPAYVASSSTYTFFPEKIYDGIIEKILSECGEGGKECGELSKIFGFGYCAVFESREDMEEKVKRWPSVKFSFGDKEFEWTGRNYLFNLSTTNTFRGCFGFEKDSSSEVIVLGMNFFRGNDVIFDREKQKLGVIEADCNRGLTPEKYVPWESEAYKQKLEEMKKEMEDYELKEKQEREKKEKEERESEERKARERKEREENERKEREKKEKEEREKKEREEKEEREKKEKSEKSSGKTEEQEENKDKNTSQNSENSTVSHQYNQSVKQSPETDPKFSDPKPSYLDADPQKSIKSTQLNYTYTYYLIGSIVVVTLLCVIVVYSCCGRSSQYLDVSSYVKEETNVEGEGKQLEITEMGGAQEVKIESTKDEL